MGVSVCICGMGVREIIKMILQQAMMRLSKTENGVQTKINKLVMLWKEVGLCVHKSAYITNGTGYVISHFNSGKSILRNIKTKQQAEEYLVKLQEVCLDWTFTLGQWEGISNEDRAEMGKKVRVLQDEINKEE